MFTVTLLGSPLRVNVLLARIAPVEGLGEFGESVRVARSPEPAPTVTGPLSVRLEVTPPPPPASPPPLLTVTAPATDPEPPSVPPLSTVTTEEGRDELMFNRPA